MNRTIYILCFLILISSCKSKLEDESIFPKVKNVTDLKKTDFVTTLESSFNTKNNSIYAATIPFAWNEIKKEIKKPLKGFTSKELEELNKTKSFLNTLKKEEYSVSIEVSGNEIRAKAYFRKSLPFKEPLIKFEKSLTFGKSKVESFGFFGKNNNAKINYFNNQNDFSISLFPKDKDHEIVLIMNHTTKNGFSDFTKYLKALNQQNIKNVNFNNNDKVEIPIIEFNIEKIFSQFIGSKFRTEITEYEIAEAYQRNAFILNENGTEVESEADIATEAVKEIERPKPKIMIFDKPFVIFLKRKNVQNPYFGVYVANDELLKKQ